MLTSNVWISSFAKSLYYHVWGWGLSQKVANVDVENLEEGSHKPTLLSMSACFWKVEPKKSYIWNLVLILIQEGWNNTSYLEPFPEKFTPTKRLNHSGVKLWGIGAYKSRLSKYTYSLDHCTDWFRETHEK